MQPTRVTVSTLEPLCYPTVHGAVDFVVCCLWRGGGGGHNYGGVDGTLGAILTYENFSLNFTLITALILLRAKHDNIT